MRPELAVRNKVKALERKKAQLHALIIFLQSILKLRLRPL